jgi:RHH-type proline utilization regulon transcriptional repressor/proline dehydrogenase/delta 1-pyrroline-5-carboxylate dehydrogenase
MGAVVGSQQLGGERLSDKGTKAGGPQYLTGIAATTAPVAAADSHVTTLDEVRAALKAATATPEPDEALILPGPTGESNRLTSVQRAPLLCLGPGPAAAMEQARRVRELGGEAVEAPGLPADVLATLAGFSGVLHWGTDEQRRPYAQALAGRAGPILPLIAQPDVAHVRLERHVCIDTTASGGNAQLLAEVGTA